MPKTMSAEDLVNNPKVQKYIDQIDADAQYAMDVADTVIGSPTGKLYSSSTLSTYKGDYARLDRCWGNFNAAWNKVVFGKAKNNKELIKTYTKYVLALEILEASNIKHEAVMESGLAVFIAALHGLVIKIIGVKKKRLEALRKELEDLLALLKQAEREVTEAKAQLVLNVAVTAVSFCLGPVGWGARIGVALGGMAVHTIIDASLGPSSGSIEGSVNTVAGESVELVDKLSKGGKKLGGAASAVLTLGLDVGEIGEADAIVRKIQKKIPVVVKQYEKLTKESATWARDIEKSKKGFATALKAYKTAANKGAKAVRSRQELMKEFKSWK